MNQSFHYKFNFEIEIKRQLNNLVFLNNLKMKK